MNPNVAFYQREGECFSADLGKRSKVV